MRPRPPLWLNQPSRYAGIARNRARAVLAVVALLILSSWHAPFAAAPPAAMATDLALYDGIVAGIDAGGSYYDVTAGQLRALDYPLRPFSAFRPPALAVVQSALPAIVVPALMILIAVSAGIVWLARLMRDAVARPAPLIGASVLLGAGLVGFVQWRLWPIHDLWAGGLVALSLGMRRPGLWLSAVAIGLAAALVRETAAIYLIVMAAIAFAEGARREAAGWAAGFAIFAAALVLHAWAAAHAAGPLDPRSAASAAFHGPGLVVQVIAQSSALRLLPLWAAGPLVALALFGWSAWAHPAATRVAATIAVAVLAISLFPASDAFGWAALATPLLLVGLVFAPDGLRDLGLAAIDMRRVRVQRITR